ncbi:MAG TPA: 3-hydroxyacyl-CoA dehydrogenase NAD-binding domain-containing protein [Burkholderiales bacterium]|nr:3-hydroxyacyl-CoA dehydrogenase NAD-binding domain-containing protein [Burkholderiales bacterium]
MDRAQTRYKHWRYETDAQGLIWLTFDKQGESANTFSRDVIDELLAVLDEIAAARPKGLVLRSGKDSFIAGADVNEFVRFKDADEALAFTRKGWDMTQKMRDLPFPTTAMVNGFCMGGGLELALGCRYRVALDDPKTRFAFPEVMLGIWPFWHGLMWLPKLVGPAAALDMILTGKTVDARRAKRMGLVDEAVPLRILENTARMVTLEARPPKGLGFVQRMLLGPLRAVVVGQARKQVAKRARPEHYPAPYAILKAWQQYDGDTFACKDDPTCSLKALTEHPTTRNLIRIFFLQERMKGLAKGVDFRAKHVHIVGAGVMGGDIAAVCAMRGITVTLQDTSPERLAPAVERAAKLFKRRLREPARIRDAMDRLIPDVAGTGAARADVILEAIFEDLKAKRELFAKLEAMAKPSAVLASNTSSLKLSDIAAQFKDPSRLVGIHFFNPVPQMMLVEVVDAAGTNPAHVKNAIAFVRQIDKLPLPVKDSPGFLVNRVLGPYLQNAFRMLDEGVTAETLDAAMEEFGMPMGPIELADTVGLDICLHAGKQLAKKDAQGHEPEAPKILLDKVALGQLGRKSGQGIYRWENSKPVKGAAGSHDERLVQALIQPYLDESRAVLAEGIVPDGELIDAGLIFGSGFAPFRGGPLHYLESQKK